MDRRSFLGSVMACMAGGGLPAALAAAPVPAGFTSSLRTLFADIEGAVAVGRRYLEGHRDEASAAWLKSTLFGLDIPLAAGRVNAEQCGDRLRERCERDFRSGDLVVVDGWFLARTEARLLALLALLPA